MRCVTTVGMRGDTGKKGEEGGSMLLEMGKQVDVLVSGGFLISSKVRVLGSRVGPNGWCLFIVVLVE